MSFDQSPAGLATLYAEIGRQLLAYESRADAFAAVARTAVARVPGAEWASITRGSAGGTAGARAGGMGPVELLAGRDDPEVSR